MAQPIPWHRGRVSATSRRLPGSGPPSRPSACSAYTAGAIEHRQQPRVAPAEPARRMDAEDRRVVACGPQCQQSAERVYRRLPADPLREQGDRGRGEHIGDGHVLIEHLTHPEASRVADSELPPRSKKLSVTDTASRSRTSANTSRPASSPVVLRDW